MPLLRSCKLTIFISKIVAYIQQNHLRYEPKERETISQYITDRREEFTQKVKNPDPQDIFLFRGHADENFSLKSTLVRKEVALIVQEAVYGSRKTTFKTTEELRNEEKKRIQRAQKLVGKNVDIMECLSRLRHYGAPSLALDFSRDFYVALWFACEGEGNGEIFVTTAQELQKKGTEEAPLTDFFAGEGYWVPSTEEPRILSQKGVLLCVKDPAKVQSIEVDSNKKEAIREYLKQYHGIDAFSIYPDIPGCAQFAN